MRAAPAFWARGGLAALALAPLGRIYGRISGQRMRRPPEVTVPVPVICVGNFTLGGAGKTPVALALAAIAKAHGEHPVFLTRGYGGRLRGPVVVDPAHHSAEEVGDEPLMLAGTAPTVVARDRAAGAIAAARAGAGCLVLDDGLQNPALARDLNLAVVDAGYGVGNGRVFPAGPLRAPLGIQLGRTDALVVAGRGRAAERLVRAAARRGLPVLHGALRPRNPDLFEGLKVLLFAGIGRPAKVAETLRAIGASVEIAFTYPDHHAYTDAEALRILALAEETGLVPVTTEKDAVRLLHAPNGPRRRLALAAKVLRVRFVFEDEERAWQLMATAFERAAARRLPSLPV